MKTHHLKTDPTPFCGVWAGDKTHEIRLNDRDFQVGDCLVLFETENSGEMMRACNIPVEFTGRMVCATVSHIQEGYGLMPGWVIMSLQEQTTSTVAPNDARELF